MAEKSCTMCVKILLIFLRFFALQHFEMLCLLPFVEALLSGSTCYSFAAVVSSSWSHEAKKALIMADHLINSALAEHGNEIVIKTIF